MIIDIVAGALSFAFSSIYAAPQCSYHLFYIFSNLQTLKLMASKIYNSRVEMKHFKRNHLYKYEDLQSLLND